MYIVNINVGAHKVVVVIATIVVVMVVVVTIVISENVYNFIGINT